MGIEEAKQALEDLKSQDPTLADETKDETIIEGVYDTNVDQIAKLTQINTILRMYCSDSQTRQKAYDAIKDILGW